MAVDILIGLVLITCIGLLIFAVSYIRNKNTKHFDGFAKITGSCGDTLEIRLDFANGKVVRSLPRSNGCAHSFNCIYSASEMAYGHTPEEILKLDKETLIRKVGNLPEDHENCAELAVLALHGAAKNYLKNASGNKHN